MYYDAGFVLDFCPSISNSIATEKCSALSQNIQQYHWEMSDAGKMAIVTEYYGVLKILFCD